MQILELAVESGQMLSVRAVHVEEAVSKLFTVDVWALSANPDLDLETIVGRRVELRVATGWNMSLLGGNRSWMGICSSIEQVHAEQTGLSTYRLRISPRLWLLTQRSNYRVFQHLSIPAIIDKLLAEWNIEFRWEIDPGRYPKLEYKVQYGETDFAFFCRLLEEAGIAFTFPFEPGEGSKLVLGDKLHQAQPRGAPPIPFVDNPSHTTGSEKEYISKVRLSRVVRPGAHTIRDYDFRNPSYKLLGESPRAKGPESEYEQYRYEPGGFLVETSRGGDTPVADDKGVARYEQKFGHERATREFWADRSGRRALACEGNVIDLWPGAVFSIANHPHAELAESTRLLVVAQTFGATPGGEWRMSCRAVFAEEPFQTTRSAIKPEAGGVQSATVVGPPGQEIHTDEFGRVRVQFPWDREGKNDDNSSCWIRVSQGWAGTGYGFMAIPRIGQEVIVGFLEADPDQPVIVGRVFNQKNPVPYKLPEHKTRSTWKTNSSMGGGGFNEIMFEDLKGKELVYLQAEKNLRKLVKNDETITVGNNRQKLVKMNETETTGQNRTEVTGENRTEITLGNRMTTIGGTMRKLVKEDEVERTEGSLTLYVNRDQHIIVHETRRELVEKDSHLRVKGFRNEQVDNTQSVTIGKNYAEKVAHHRAIEAGQEIHLKAGSKIVIEAADDLTLKGPGGFIRIDATGVTIKGTMVRINSGGSPGSGSGATTATPELPRLALIEEPVRPDPDDVSKTGLAQ